MCVYRCILQTTEALGMRWGRTIFRSEGDQAGRQVGVESLFDDEGRTEKAYEKHPVFASQGQTDRLLAQTRSDILVSTSVSKANLHK